MTFQGYQGIGNWHGTPVAEVLPVDIRPIYDDRVERPEGAKVSLTDTDHPITAGLDDDGLPIVYGYNEVDGLKTGATSLATVDEKPLLAVDEFGEGRTVAYASDPGIKWGLEMVDWNGYSELWYGALEWATGGE